MVHMGNGQWFPIHLIRENCLRMVCQFHIKCAVKGMVLSLLQFWLDRSSAFLIGSEDEVSRFGCWIAQLHNLGHTHASPFSYAPTTPKYSYGVSFVSVWEAHANPQVRDEVGVLPDHKYRAANPQSCVLPVAHIRLYQVGRH